MLGRAVWRKPNGVAAKLWAVNYDSANLAYRKRLYAAVLMFQSGELSAGAAAEFAQVDRFTFAAECERHGVPLVDYPVEDLDRDLASLRTGS